MKKVTHYYRRNRKRIEQVEDKPKQSKAKPKSQPKEQSSDEPKETTQAEQ